jgi:hypothetical protein
MKLNFKKSKVQTFRCRDMFCVKFIHGIYVVKGTCQTSKWSHLLVSISLTIALRLVVI